METLISLVTGGFGAAIVAGIFKLVEWKLDRKAVKEDKEEESMAEHNKKVDDAMDGFRKTLDVLIEADRTILYDTIKRNVKEYTARGYITFEELEDLERMHKVYHDKDKLNGNGFLDGMMKTARALEKK